MTEKKLFEEEPPIVEKCETCRFCHIWGTLKPQIHECIRRSPIISTIGKWPKVNSDDWCGDYKRRN